MSQFPDIMLPERPAHPEDQSQFVNAWIDEVRKNPSEAIIRHAMAVIVANIREADLVHTFVRILHKEYPQINTDVFNIFTKPEQILPLEVQHYADTYDQKPSGETDGETVTYPQNREYGPLETVYVPLWMVILVVIGGTAIGSLIGYFIGN